MGDAYFRSSLGRRGLIEWLRRDFDCNIEKIEQCGQGAMYLHILDKIFPNLIPMQKVNWNSNSEYDMIKNYKLLQLSLKKAKLTKDFCIESLIKRKHQNNLEFLQWIKVLYDKQLKDNVNLLEYNAFERRQLGIGPLPHWALSAKNIENTDQKNKGKQRTKSSVNKENTIKSPQVDKLNNLYENKCKVLELICCKNVNVEYLDKKLIKEVLSCEEMIDLSTFE